MLTQRHEALDHQALELCESSWVLAAHQFNVLATKKAQSSLYANVNLNHLLCQFKWRGLAIDISWWVWKQKAKVNMDNMALRIKQDIAIMSIFNLDNIAE